jgi:hypothetical protein
MREPTLEQVARLAEQLSPVDKQSLIEQLERQIQCDQGSTASPAPAARPQSLRGAWRDHFPDDLDLEAALGEIRQEWQEEWREATAE